jgi:hypothetical protein
MITINERLARIESLLDQAGTPFVYGDPIKLPECWLVRPCDDGFIINSPKVAGVGANTFVNKDSTEPAEKLLFLLLKEKINERSN